MPDSADGSITQLFALARRGDDAAAARLWQQFLPRMLGLARKTLSSQPRLLGLDEDAVQSAFASFFRRARDAAFDINNRDELWNLLGVITVRKARRVIRRENAEKRGGGQVRNEEALPRQADGPQSLDGYPSPEVAAEFDLHAEELLAQLSAELRSVAVLRLLGYTNQEIAKLLDWTVRKVERKLHLIRLGWEKEFPGE